MAEDLTAFRIEILHFSSRFFPARYKERPFKINDRVLRMKMLYMNFSTSLSKDYLIKALGYYKAFFYRSRALNHKIKHKRNYFSFLYIKVQWHSVLYLRRGPHFVTRNRLPLLSSHVRSGIRFSFLTSPPPLPYLLICDVSSYKFATPFSVFTVVLW